MSEDILYIHEIYRSIQGESTHAGLPCTFVRTAGCNLRCRWCDTVEAFAGGTPMPRREVRERALSFATALVAVTGGEPLLQPSVLPLLTELCDAGRTVLLETSGERNIATVDSRVRRIVDLKAPSSGQCHRNRYENIELLRPGDELKFVLADRQDYQWMRRTISQRGLSSTGVPLLASCVHGLLAPSELVAWILEDELPVRVQLQLHKYIWPPGTSSV